MQTTMIATIHEADTPNHYRKHYKVPWTSTGCISLHQISRAKLLDTSLVAAMVAACCIALTDEHRLEARP